MKNIVGLSICVVSICLGLYLGLWVGMVGGIVGLFNAIQSTPIEGYDVAISLIKILFVTTIGKVIGVLGFSIGCVVIAD